MASTYFGADVGDQNAADVSVGTSTTSSDVELVVDDTNLATAAIDSKVRILECLDAIRQRIVEYDY